MTVKGGSWRDQEDEDNTKGSSPFKKLVPLEYGDDGDVVSCGSGRRGKEDDPELVSCYCCVLALVPSLLAMWKLLPAAGCRLPSMFFQLRHTYTPFCSSPTAAWAPCYIGLLTPDTPSQPRRRRESGLTLRTT